MKYIYLIVSFLLIEHAAFSQIPNGARPAGGNMNVGHFYGKIVDANKKGLPGITLQIKGNKFDLVTKKSTEAILGTTLTANNGDFNFENLPVMGNFKLTISGLGFIKLEKQVNFGIKMGGGQSMQEMMALVDKDLGNIKLEESTTDLQSVTVTSTAKPQFEMGIDRKIFNVDKNLTSTGQTAVEVMKNIPNLNVDIDGNVTLRNAAPTLLIDNRPTTLTMDQIPADIIDKVEIITNPSAKYDATGGNAGILNIVLKKNRKNGYNGGIRSGIDMRGKFNGGGDMNVRDSKFNFSLNANVNGRKSISTSESDRQILGTSIPTSVQNNNNNTSNGSFDFYRGGVDYFADNRNTFSLYANIMEGSFNNGGGQVIDSIKNGIMSSDNLINSSNFHFLNKGGQLSYKHLFEEKGHELAADFNYNESDNTNWSNVNYQKAILLNQKSIGSGNNKNYSSNVDYSKELSPVSKIEAGGKYNYRSEFNLSNQYRNDVLLNSISNQYRYSESVFAGYVNFNTKVEKWSFQLGLRAESRSYEGHLLTNKGIDSLPYSTNYPISLFPSAFINYKLDDKQDFQLNYSKRISPPNFFQLLPFPNYSDPQNINIGNPKLKPQFTHSFEIAYNNAYTKGANFLATAYYKYSTDLITSYVYRDINPINKTDSVYFSSSINANTAIVYGLELSNKTAITKWWDMNLSFNLFKSAITATIPGQNVNNDLTSWFSKINNTFKLGGGYSFQFSGQYQAKTILPPGGNSGGGGGRGMGGGFGGGGFGGPQSTAQGYNFPSYDFDMALKKDWTLKGGRTASLSLSVNDVFKTRLSKTYSESQYFIQNVTRIRDQQIFRLNFSYRFGKFDVNLLKRKNNKMDDGGGMDQMPQ
ncbi:MAG: outer membrane beta-barrel family protein [Chitinophagia bacterium]|jgi:outer membrane receptor protein involved in Fe transport